MTDTNPRRIDLQQRQENLSWLLNNQSQMLIELASVAGVDPHSTILEDASAAIPAIDAFLTRTDLDEATEDARIWLTNRLALFIAQVLIRRYGGRIVVNENPHSAFFARIVVSELSAPAADGTSLDPFALAHDLVSGSTRVSIRSALTDVHAQLFSARPT